MGRVHRDPKSTPSRNTASRDRHRRESVPRRTESRDAVEKIPHPGLYNSLRNRKRPGSGAEVKFSLSQGRRGHGETSAGKKPTVVSSNVGRLFRYLRSGWKPLTVFFSFLLRTFIPVRPENKWTFTRNTIYAGWFPFSSLFACRFFLPFFADVFI